MTADEIKAGQVLLVDKPLSGPVFRPLRRFDTPFKELGLKAKCCRCSRSSLWASIVTVEEDQKQSAMGQARSINKSLLGNAFLIQSR